MSTVDELGYLNYSQTNFFILMKEYIFLICPFWTVFIQRYLSSVQLETIFGFNVGLCEKGS